MSPPVTFAITLDMDGDKVGERVGVRGSSGAMNVHCNRIALCPLTLSLSPKSLPGTPFSNTTITIGNDSGERGPEFVLLHTARVIPPFNFSPEGRVD